MHRQEILPARGAPGVERSGERGPGDACGIWCICARDSAAYPGGGAPGTGTVFSCRTPTSCMDDATALMLNHVRAALPASGAHGFDHTLRVVRLAEAIGAREGADMAVLIPAAIFHDIARPVEEETGAPHEEAGARMAEAYLCSISYPADLVPGIFHAIRAHRYSSGVDPGTLEARVLSDADNLDAMGAVGIARTFMQAGEKGGGILDATDHIRAKLVNLRGRMYTDTAREIAGKRHALLVAFLNALDDEVRGP